MQFPNNSTPQFICHRSNISYELVYNFYLNLIFFTRITTIPFILIFHSITECVIWMILLTFWNCFKHFFFQKSKSLWILQCIFILALYMSTSLANNWILFHNPFPQFCTLFLILFCNIVLKRRCLCQVWLGFLKYFLCHRNQVLL